MARKRHQLINARKVAGLSQERLAAVVGVERSTVVRWERGETCPQPWARPKLACALGTSNQALAELLQDIAEPDTVAPAGPPAEEVEALLRRDFMGAVVGLAASLPPVDMPSFGRRFGIAQASQLVERTARRRRLDDLLGGADTYQLYASELAATTDSPKRRVTHHRRGERCWQSSPSKLNSRAGRPSTPACRPRRGSIT